MFKNKTLFYSIDIKCQFFVCFVGPIAYLVCIFTILFYLKNIRLNTKLHCKSTLFTCLIMDSRLINRSGINNEKKNNKKKKIPPPKKKQQQANKHTKTIPVHSFY